MSIHTHLYLPPAYVPETAGETPVIFLAGPIQGAQDWQDEASRLLLASRPDIIVASPRRDYLLEEFDYEGQVNWETHHLQRAARHGLILFWLAREEYHITSRAYAQTSRFELAEWKVHHQQGKCTLVLGIERGFSGANYIRLRFAQDCPDVSISTTLHETCASALALLSS